MFGIPLIEWIGYLASILIAISMFMKDIVKLRFINLVGSLLFAFYGFSIKAEYYTEKHLPFSIIVFINIYYLYKLYNKN